MGILLNSVLQTAEGDDVVNYIQAFINDGEKNINYMKLKKEKSCKAKFRNLPGEEPFYLRIEYRKPNVYIMYYNSDQKSFQSCISFQEDLDFDGTFALTSGTGMTNYDHVYVDSFALYNPD